MNKKITFAELSDLLCAVNSLPKKTNESLLKDFFNAVQESLEKGENVKIRHLGMLKLVRVEARKSVNVNTGKEIEIPVHNKVVFIPEKELAEAVNLPFANFETIEIDDSISEDKINDISGDSTPEPSQCSDASKDTPPAIPQNENEDTKQEGTLESDNTPSEEKEDSSPKDEALQANNTPSEEKEDNSPKDEALESDASAENIEESPKQDEALETNSTTEEEESEPEVLDDNNHLQSVCPPPIPEVKKTEDTSADTPEPIILDNANNIQEDSNSNNDKTPPVEAIHEEEAKEEQTAQDDIVTETEQEANIPPVSEENPISETAEPIELPMPSYPYTPDIPNTEPIPAPKEKCSFWKGFFWGVISGSIFVLLIMFVVTLLAGFPLIIKEKGTVEEQETETSIEQTTDETSQPEAPSTEAVTTTPAPKVENVIVRDTITQKKFLTTLARKYYGDYNYWVYIYEENKDIISDPNAIKPGTVVVIPPASKYGIDKSNPKSLSDARKKVAELSK